MTHLFFDENEKREINEEQSKTKPDLEYLKVLGVINKEIIDLVEENAIKENKEHFLENIFFMIEKGLEEYELGIRENKFNKKVSNLISKTDEELLELGLDPEDIIKLRVKIDRRKFVVEIMDLLENNKQSIIKEYLCSLADYKKRDLGLELSDFDLFKGSKKRGEKNKIN